MFLLQSFIQSPPHPDDGQFESRLVSFALRAFRKFRAMRVEQNLRPRGLCKLHQHCVSLKA